MKLILSILFTTVYFLSAQLAFGIDQTRGGTAAVQTIGKRTYQKNFVGSTVFLLGNLAPGDPPNFFQLSYGRHLTPKGILFVEAITWTYYEPLGDYGSSDESYPGKVKAYGLGVGYQYFHWRKLYSTVQATPFAQKFYGEDNLFIQNGFQLYLQFRIGYRLELFKNRWFLEPSAAFNYWPVNTNFPAAFEDVEQGNPNYFLFEPGLNFGFKF